MMESLIYHSLKSQELVCDVRELTARLGAPYEDMKDMADAALSELRGVIKPCYAVARVKIYRSEGGIQLGFGEINSQALSKALSGCREGYIAACTLGIGADRLIASRRMALGEGFVLDAVASALAEALINKCRADTIRCDGVDLLPPFSPGYSDFSLSHQPALLDLLDAKRRLGIYVGESLLMVPSKSITAVMGKRSD